MIKMARNTEQRKIANQIYDLKRKQKILRKEWLDLDIKIGVRQLRLERMGSKEVEAKF